MQIEIRVRVNVVKVPFSGQRLEGAGDSLVAVGGRGGGEGGRQGFRQRDKSLRSVAV